MLTNIEAVIFDLDGTLVDSMGMWHEIDKAYLGKFEIPLPIDLQKEIEGLSFSETAQYFKNTFAIPDTVEKIQKDWNEMAWDQYCNQVPLKNGVMEFLEYLKENNIKVGIATSNSRELVTAILQSHGIQPYFSCIMTSNEVPKGKPAPDIYLKVAENFQVPPEKCLVFEDIVNGIQAGLSAGMRVCAVEDVYSAYQRDMKAKMAHYYIESYRELLAV